MYTALIHLGGKQYAPSEIIAALEPHVTEERSVRIRAIATRRTLRIHTVLDGLYDRGNTSAVMRSAEALGFANLHLIETQEKFKAANRVTQGTDKWLNIHKWQNPEDCAVHLKELGLQIIATDLEAAVPLDEIDFTQPTAVVLGNERDGVSDAFKAAADACVIIPMIGMAQSFNISVAAAITLYHVSLERKRALGRYGDVDEDEIETLIAQYLLRCFDQPEKLLER